MSRGKLAKGELQSAIREISAYESRHLAELYRLDYATENKVDDLVAAGYTITNFDPNLSEAAALAEVRRLHSTGADVAFPSARIVHVVAVKRPVERAQIAELTRNGYSVHRALNSSFGRRITLEQHVSDGDAIEFTIDGYWAVMERK